ncbi:dephospho-CoA kinase [Pseudogracilibacillus sp. SE30717A]|uniref:dephospho-CoA kinase n=1 Tax=Pseudogracilibacillus sp. SE30717A TaxID=3098293 RepID=UPI00300E5AAD
MTLIIGLTGSIGTGKSLISNQFRKLNIPVVDADLIAREVVEPGQKAYTKIVETFGEDILHDDDTLDRKALGNIVFNDQEKRKKLNAIIHPAIRKEMLKQRDEYVQQGELCVVLDIPLLYESGLTHYVDKVIVVFVEPEVQVKRIISRDNSTEEEARSRINSQIPVADKVNKADAVIDNNGSKEESYKQLEDILKQWGIILS